MSNANSISATCLRCKAAVPVQLHGALHCPHCGAVDEVAPEVRSLLASVRERVAARKREIQQFLGQDRVFTEKFFGKVTGQLPLLIVLWILMGAMFWGIAGTAAEGVSVSALISGAEPLSNDDRKLAWFVVYCAALFAVFTFGLPILGLSRARKAALATRPVAPVAAGAAPRCRCCLAPLPERGTVRRCEFCGADHLVLDERYQAEQASLDAAVQAALAEGERQVRSRLARAEALVSWGLASVIFSLPALPCVGGILFAALEPSPKLFLVPAIAGGLALGVYLRAWSKLRRIAG